MLFNYWYFSRKYAQIEKLSCYCQYIFRDDHDLSKSGKEKLVLLNLKRIELQKMIGEITILNYSICNKCTGKCCRGQAKYFFTALDFWLRKFSSNPVSDFGHVAYRPWYFYLNRRFQQVVSRITPGEKDQRGFCQYLRKNGCKLNVDDRPIKCLVATCQKIRQAMDASAKSKYGSLIYELFLVSLSTFDVLKNEAKVPSSFGRLSVLLTP